MAVWNPTDYDIPSHEVTKELKIKSLDFGWDKKYNVEILFYTDKRLSNMIEFYGKEEYPSLNFDIFPAKSELLFCFLQKIGFGLAKFWEKCGMKEYFQYIDMMKKK